MSAYAMAQHKPYIVYFTLCLRFYHTCRGVSFSIPSWHLEAYCTIAHSRVAYSRTCRGPHPNLSTPEILWLATPKYSYTTPKIHFIPPTIRIWSCLHQSVRYPPTATQSVPGCPPNRNNPSPSWFKFSFLYRHQLLLRVSLESTSYSEYVSLSFGLGCEYWILQDAPIFPRRITICTRSCFTF